MPGQLQSVGSPGSPASPYGPMPGEQSAFDLSKSMSKEITVQQLLTFLLRDVEKTKHYRRLPFYILFLAVLTTLIGLTGLGDVWYNEFADHNNAISQMFQREGLKVTDSHDELWTWLSQTLDWAWVDSATSSTSEEVCQLAASKAACRIPCSWVEGRNCTASPVGRRNVALGFLLLRQWRVDDAEQCTEHTGDRLIPESVRQSLPKTCTKRYRSSVASTRAYGGPTGNLYVSDEEAGGVAVGSDITTLVHTFEKQHQFSTRFSFERGLKEAQQNLTNLRLNGWVTPETRLVALSAVFYNPNTLAFLSNDAYIEFFHTGKVLSGYLARPFPVLSLDSDVDRAVFALDVMHLVLCCPILMWSFVRAVRDNMTWMRIPGSTAIGLWEVFEFFHIVSHVVTAVYRVYLWAESLKMTRPDFYEGETDEMAIMFNNLVFYSHLWRTGWAWCCCAVVMAYLRSFKYLQHNQRLCVLSETIRTAAGDLAGMSVIFTVVIIAYGIGGTMLYSSEIAEFTSFGTSCVYLLQVLFAGEIVGGIWDQLFRMHSLASPLYMLTYFLLSWVVLLNMVIAALSNAFILVVQQQAFHRRGEASGAARTSIWFDIIKGVRKGWKRLNGQQLLGNAKTEDSDAASEAESLGGGEGSLRGGTAPARSRRKGRDPTEFLMLRTNKLKERFLAVSGALKSLADEKIGLSDDPQFAYLGEMRYSQIYVTWAEVNDCLGGILTESQRLQMFTHIHKLVACDEKNREVVNVSQRYVNKLSDEISDALNALRKGGVAGGPVGPSAHPAATATRNPLHGGGGGGGGGGGPTERSFVRSSEVFRPLTESVGESTESGRNTPAEHAYDKTEPVLTGSPSLRAAVPPPPPPPPPLSSSDDPFAATTARVARVGSFGGGTMRDRRRVGGLSGLARIPSERLSRVDSWRGGGSPTHPGYTPPVTLGSMTTTTAAAAAGQQPQLQSRLRGGQVTPPAPPPPQATSDGGASDMLDATGRWFSGAASAGASSTTSRAGPGYSKVGGLRWFSQDGNGNGGGANGLGTSTRSVPAGRDDDPLRQPLSPTSPVYGSLQI